MHIHSALCIHFVSRLRTHYRLLLSLFRLCFLLSFFLFTISYHYGVFVYRSLSLSSSSLFIWFFPSFTATLFFHYFLLLPINDPFLYSLLCLYMFFFSHTSFSRCKLQKLCACLSVCMWLARWAATKISWKHVIHIHTNAHNKHTKYDWLPSTSLHRMTSLCIQTNSFSVFAAIQRWSGQFTDKLTNQTEWSPVGCYAFLAFPNGRL